MMPSGNGTPSSFGGGGGGGGRSECACLVDGTPGADGAASPTELAFVLPVGCAAANRAANSVALALGKFAPKSECLDPAASLIMPVPNDTRVDVFVPVDAPAFRSVSTRPSTAAATRTFCASAELATAVARARYASASVSIIGFNTSISLSASSHRVFSRRTLSPCRRSSHSPCSAIVSSTTDAYA